MMVRVAVGGLLAVAVAQEILPQILEYIGGHPADFLVGKLHACLDRLAPRVSQERLKVFFVKAANQGLPDDPELYGQLLDRKIVPHPKGKLAIESKQSMKDPNRDGGSARSPDRADAVVGAIAPLTMTQSR